jgi:Zn-dependent metalloprotease
MGDWSREKLPARAIARAEGDPPTGDRAVDEAYDALGTFHRFFKDVFGRDSWDGKGGALEAVVHYGRDFDNCFWDGRRVVLGDGDGRIFRPFHRLDMVAKECSAGLVQSESKMRYQGQAGALIESLGFAFASLVKQYSLNQTAAGADWLIGDGLLVKGKALVSLEEPGTAFDDSLLGKDTQVGHMSKYVRTQWDNGGVHINCGIPNRAFALAAKALRGRSWERAGRIWYEALLGKDLGSGTFLQFARRTAAVAKARFADMPAVAAAVRKAWSQVGIKA